MIPPVRSIVSILTLVSLVNCAVIYRGTASGSLDESAHVRLLARQSSGLKDAAASGKKSSSDVPKFEYGTPDPNYPGVVGTGKIGPTNPKKPSLGTAVNQTSISRLASINGVDDWCTFGPKDNSKELGEVEEEVVAYCTKPRNGARVIPDGTVTAAHFVKTPLYVQVMARGDFTKINFQEGDTGGELDPHGATNLGNPHGGNVTSNVTGKDVFYEEWMNYVGSTIMCFRVCIAGSDQAPPQSECQHTLDEMGCWTVMPGDYSDDVFDSCDADAAYPPGIYVTGGTTSSFQQYATGVWTDNGKLKSYTNGVSTQTTPTTAMSTPSSSNCRTVSSISNGIQSIIPTQSSSSAADDSRVAAAKTSSASSASPTSSTSSADSTSGSGSSADAENDSTSSNKSSSDSESGALALAPTLRNIGILLAACVLGTVVL